MFLFIFEWYRSWADLVSTLNRRRVAPPTVLFVAGWRKRFRTRYTGPCVCRIVEVLALAMCQTVRREYWGEFVYSSCFHLRISFFGELDGIYRSVVASLAIGVRNVDLRKAAEASTRRHSEREVADA